MNKIKYQMDCLDDDGSVRFGCYSSNLENGHKPMGNHIPPGQGSINQSWSVEIPMKSNDVPKAAVINPPGTGTVDGWSYELPIVDVPSNSTQTNSTSANSTLGEGDFTGGGGSFGGGGATGSY